MNEVTRTTPCAATMAPGRVEWETEARAWGFTDEQIKALADDDLREAVLGAARVSTLRRSS